jgi:hypothetical protein
MYIPLATKWTSATCLIHLVGNVFKKNVLHERIVSDPKTTVTWMQLECFFYLSSSLISQKFSSNLILKYFKWHYEPIYF